jgi:hypothetical protein
MPLKIKQPKVKKITDRVYLVTFSSRFDLTMTFMRYQEYYESPKFRNKNFSLMEFMRWYSLAYGDGAFTYTKDWNGFNIPAIKIFEVLNSLGVETAWDKMHEYDYCMFGIVSKIKEQLKDENFYLIGIHSDDKDKETQRHEIAHGLFWTNSEYRNKMTALVKALPKTAKTHLKKVLRKRGYCKNVFIDEIHAYMATGLIKAMSKKLLNKHRKPFQSVLKEYYK